MQFSIREPSLHFDFLKTNGGRKGWAVGKEVKGGKIEEGKQAIKHVRKGQEKQKFVEGYLEADHVCLLGYLPGSLAWYFSNYTIKTHFIKTNSINLKK